LSEQQKAELKVAQRIGITTELEELWWHEFNAEKPLGLKKKQAMEKAQELEWVKEAIHEEMSAERKRRNNRQCANRHALRR
jgi:hypothetical protein